MPRVLGGRYQQENGALLYVSQRGMDALWTKLFLFDGESESFSLVYDDSDSRFLSYFQGQVRGPLRIWKINYPADLTVPKAMEREYLATTSPAWMNISQRSIIET